MPQNIIRIKRIYDESSTDDGFRVLVDRLWPRGVSKEEAQFDEWLKEIAPSDELRQSFGHDPGKWEKLKEKYFAELEEKPELVGELREMVEEHEKVTLLYAAKDEEHNNARALNLFLEK